MRRDPLALQRALERRERENQAERLLDKVPTLKSLSLTIQEQAVDGSEMHVVYTRHIVVERAPALFTIPCCDHACNGGGHDLTSEVLRGLRKGKAHFEGKDRCAGTVREADCPFELSFVAEATYG